MVAVIILAIAVISAVVHAARLSEQAVESNQRLAEITQESIEQNESIKQTEINMAVSVQIIEIYNFFIKEIFIKNFFSKENEDILRERCNEILFQSSILFNQHFYDIVEKSVNTILDAYVSGFPSYTEEGYERAKNDPRAGIEIKIYEAFINRENTAEDIIKSYEKLLNKAVFLANIRIDIAAIFSYFKLNLGPEDNSL
jgi:hypothetical protein